MRASGCEVQRPFRQQGDELLAQLPDAVPGFCAHRVQRDERPELGGRGHLARDVAGLQAVDLVHGDHDRHAETEHA